ncbi:uncharacterized protein PGTG_21405 [Puccinia graminis f. sp. tritici CRL 75-36-700-3]|uniref:Uncharacterized protein n=1 Tax=Puccinia graminis f. sp. tritici (strain CRL 75-36-700-3 / race SCCL) TaxID=418459 RepID=H6QR83_PUCGT|nr:uncharacterized protein PGTG_21405 [Puccinia graminis f. sp. tritici CRL 75-36-700-3]EHS63065.1 hypothetical protein PGTG_21405 [Puccinia graminis f. sp. tritici CRL 75-36-700-3]
MSGRGQAKQGLQLIGCPRPAHSSSKYACGFASKKKKFQQKKNSKYFLVWEFWRCTGGGRSRWLLAAAATVATGSYVALATGTMFYTLG